MQLTVTKPQTETALQTAPKTRWQVHSQKLIECVCSLTVPTAKADAKTELMAMTSELMPAGKPNFKEVRNYPTITQLVNNPSSFSLFSIFCH
jgi:hypothetical protein